MSDSSNVRAGSAYVEIAGDDKKLQAALKRAADKFKGMQDVATDVGRNMLKVGLAITTPFLAAGKVFAETGNTLFRMSQRTGVQVEALSQLGYAAQQSGVEMETLENGIRKMQKALGASGTPKSAAALASIGLSAQALSGMSADEQLKKIADGMNSIHDPTQRAAIAMDLFGKTGTTMLPLLDQGSEGIDQMEKRAAALGLTMSTAGAKGAVQMKQGLNDVTDVLKNSFFRAGEAVAPLLTKVMNTMTRMAITANQWITAHKDILQTALKVGAGVAAAGIGFLVLGKGLGIVSSVISGVRTAFMLFGGAVSLIASGLTALASVPVFVSVALAGLAGYLLYTTETGRDMLTALGGYFTDLKDTALGAFQGITDALSVGDWALAANVAWAGLKSVWYQGIKPLREAWNDFSYGLKTRFATAVFGIEEVWSTVRNALTVGWVETTSYLGAVWQGFIDTIRDAWDTVAGWLKKGWNEVKGVFDSDFDVETANTAVDNATAKAKAERLNKSLEAERKRVEKHDTDLANEKQRHADTLAKIAKESGETQAGIDQIYNRQALEAAMDVAEAMYELEQGESKAATEAKDPKNKLPDVPLFKTPELPDGDAIMKQVKSVGTFNAAGAFGLAGNNDAATRALKIQQNIVKRVGDVVKSVDNVVKAIGGALSFT
jgi:hypothetical protein